MKITCGDERGYIMKLTFHDIFEVKIQWHIRQIKTDIRKWSTKDVAGAV